MPLFALVGKICELRLMIKFSGTNRTYCYVKYCSEKDAKEAVRRLHNYRIRPDYPLAVTISVDNRRLVARLAHGSRGWRGAESCFSFNVQGPGTLC